MKITMSHNCCGAKEIKNLNDLDTHDGTVRSPVRSANNYIPFLYFVAGFETEKDFTSFKENSEDPDCDVAYEVRDYSIYHWITGNGGDQDDIGDYMAKEFRKIGYKVTKVNAGLNGGYDAPLYFYVAVSNEDWEYRAPKKARKRA
jgi:hypothetical protein